MMKDIKKCFKLLKYGYQLKTNIACAIMFLLIGCVILLMNYEQLVVVATYFLIAVMFVTQTLHMLLFSQHVASSPSRKYIELRYLDILNSLAGVVTTLVIIPITYFCKPDDYDGVASEVLLVISGLTAILMYVYMGMAFKRMFLSMLVFIPMIFFFLSSPLSVVGEWMDAVLGGKVVLSIVIFVAEIVVGIFAGHACRNLLYSKEMSKWAKGAKLRMEQSQ